MSEAEKIMFKQENFYNGTAVAFYHWAVKKAMKKIVSVAWDRIMEHVSEYDGPRKEDFIKQLFIDK